MIVLIYIMLVRRLRGKQLVTTSSPVHLPHCTLDRDKICSPVQRHAPMVGALLCRLSPVDAHTVALKLVMGK